MSTIVCGVISGKSIILSNDCVNTGVLECAFHTNYKYYFFFDRRFTFANSTNCTINENIKKKEFVFKNMVINQIFLSFLL